jgi:hypothetical protein
MVKRLSADNRRLVLLAQGGYYVGTSAVPFISRRAFEAVTGPKREWWLVQTVAGLLTVNGGALLAGALRRETPAPLIGVAAGTAAVLSSIDLVYVAKRRIAPTFLIDAGVNLGFLTALAASRPSPGSTPRR